MVMNAGLPPEVGAEAIINEEQDVGKEGTSEPVLRPSPTSQDSSKPSAQQQQAAEIVRSLFGDVGKVVGIFSCSVARQSGRLYVSTQGLFFYSNLFGFEKKICIRYEETVELIMYRSTSLFVRTSSGDEHVLKSFQDRDAVYNVISGYCECVQIDPEIEQSLIPKTCEEVEARDSISANEMDQREDPVRLRTASENSVPALDNDNVQIPADKNAIWEAIKNLSSDWDSSVTSLKLPLATASDFFDLFLSDDAPNSLSIYHQKIMGDKNVVLDQWLRDDDNESAANSDKSFSRTLRFEHKSKVSVAQVTRNQTYRCYGELGACLKNVTNIAGVPSSDCFFVEDCWVIEKVDDGIVLDVKFRITFSKSTFLKSIIEIRTRSESIEWYGKYTSYLKEAIRDASKAVADEGPPMNEIPAKPRSDTSEQITRLMVLIFLIFVIVHIHGLRLRVMELESVLTQMQGRMLEMENQCLLGNN